MGAAPATNAALVDLNLSYGSHLLSEFRSEWSSKCRLIQAVMLCTRHLRPHFSAGTIAALVVTLVPRDGVHARTPRPAPIPVTVLNNGVAMPMLSLGIWQFSDEEVAEYVPLALSLGIRHIDASIFYGVEENGGPPNQPALGSALVGINRSSYFLTTKIDPSYDSSHAYATATAPFTRASAYFRTLEQVAWTDGCSKLG